MKKIVITDDEISIEGFGNIKFREPGKTGRNLGDCRDVARVALAWAIQKLNDDLVHDLSGNWDKQISFIAD